MPAPTAGRPLSFEDVPPLFVSWALWSLVATVATALLYGLLLMAGDSWAVLAVAAAVVGFFYNMPLPLVVAFGVASFCLCWLMVGWGSRHPLAWFVLGGLVGGAYPLFAYAKFGTELVSGMAIVVAIGSAIGGATAINRWNRSHPEVMPGKRWGWLIVLVVLVVPAAASLGQWQDVHTPDEIVLAADLQYGGKTIPLAVAYQCRPVIEQGSAPIQRHSSTVFPLPDGKAAFVNYPSPCEPAGKDKGWQLPMLSIVDPTAGARSIRVYGDYKASTGMPATSSLMSDIRTRAAKAQDWQNLSATQTFELVQYPLQLRPQERDRLQVFRAIEARHITADMWRKEMDHLLPLDRDDLTFLDDVTQPKFFAAAVWTSREAGQKLKAGDADGTEEDKWRIAGTRLWFAGTRVEAGFYDVAAKKFDRYEDGGQLYLSAGTGPDPAKDLAECDKILALISPDAAAQKRKRNICYGTFYYFDPTDKSAWQIDIQNLYYLPGSAEQP